MEDLSFLPFFLTEEIYVIPSDLTEFAEDKQSESVTIESKPEDKAPVSLKVAQPETTEVKQIKEEPKITQKQVEPAKDYIPPVYSGLFAKKILILVHTPGLNFDHKDLLLKILGAIKLTNEDVAILPSGHIKSKEDFDWMLTVDKTKLITFGLPEKWRKQISDSFENYKIYNQSNFQLLFSDNLDLISQDVNAKKQLWGALQQLVANG